jgi:hypothetical protein
LAGLRPCETDNLAQQGAFAGPASSEQDHGFSPLDVQADSVQHAPVVVTNDYVANRNGGIIHRSAAPAPSHWPSFSSACRPQRAPTGQRCHATHGLLPVAQRAFQTLLVPPPPAARARFSMNPIHVNEN